MYLKTLDTYKNPIQFEKNIPITDAYIQIKMLNAPLYHKWLITLIRLGKINSGKTSDLYKSFLKWIASNREHCVNVISQTEFGLLLGNAKEAIEGYDLDSDIGNKVKNRGVMIMNWNIDGLVNGFKKMNLLESDFVYVHSTKEDKEED